MRETTLRSKRFRLLGDENRLRILEVLLGQPMTVGQLADTLTIEQTLLSHHLRHLRQEGFVTSRRFGRQVLYSIAKKLKPNQEDGSIDLGCCRIELR